jgi:salicylate hydroxylase
MSDEAPYLIAGAGIGGLAAALILARRSIGVVVLEKRTDASEAGAGIQIGPNGTRVLDRLGLSAELTSRVSHPHVIDIFDAASGAALASLPLTELETRHGMPYVTVRRQDLHRVLLDACEAEHAITIHRGFEAVAVADHSSGVTVRGASGEVVSGAALIAADGLWSAFATAVLGAQPVRFTGQTAARALIPAERLGPPFSSGNVGLWLGREAHLVHYPVAAGSLVNFVAVTAGGGPGEDWNRPVARAAVAQAFSAWPAPVSEALSAGDAWAAWSLFERPPLASWSRNRVTVLGDAAHPMLPYLAQGGVMALEDAEALGVALDRTGPDLPVPAFALYENMRKARAGRVVAASRRNARLYHLTGLAASARNTAMRLSGGERMLRAFDWLYGYDVEAHGNR